MAPAERTRALQEIQSLIKRGDIMSAREPTDALLAANPDDADALAIKSLVLYTTGFLEEADETLRRLINVRPGNPDDHFNLARVLTRLDRTEEAFAEYDRAAALRPEYLKPVEGKAALLVLQGRRDEARALVESFIERNGDAPELGLILGTIEEQSDAFDSAAKIAEKYAGSSKATAPINRQLFFLMGRALEKLENYDEAFRSFRRGNAYGTMPYDDAGFTAKVDRTIKLFSRKNVKTMPRSALQTELPIFVTSLPRSGSTLVEKIIDAHPEARGVGEIIVMNRVAATSPETLKTKRPYPDCIETATRKGLNTLGQLYLDEVEVMAEGVNRIVDKTLETWQHVGLVQLALPNARVINVRRHPLDTCLSCYMAALSPTAHSFAATLESLAAHYRQYDRLSKHWVDAAAVEYMEVRYEDLVNDPEAKSREIIDFSGLEWRDECLDYHKKTNRLVVTLSYDQVRKPIYKSALARWKRYEKHLGPLQSLIGDLVREYDA